MKKLLQKWLGIEAAVQHIVRLENSHANLEEAICDLKAATCPDLTPAKRRTRK